MSEETSKRDQRAPEIALDLLGQTVVIRGLAALVALAATLLLMVAAVLAVFLFRQAEVTNLVSISTGRGVATGEATKDSPLIQWWLPDRETDRADMKAFDARMTEAFDWWGKQPMLNTVVEDDGTVRLVQGYQYQAELPFRLTSPKVDGPRAAVAFIDDAIVRHFADDVFAMRWIEVRLRRVE